MHAHAHTHTHTHTYTHPGFSIVMAIDFIVSLVAQLVKTLPATQESLVQFLGLGDPLEKG